MEFKVSFFQFLLVSVRLQQVYIDFLHCFYADESFSGDFLLVLWL